MKRFSLAAVALMAASLTFAGGPKRVPQTLCYDWDPVTKACGMSVTIATHPDELRGNIHRPDTLRQVKAADMSYAALGGRLFKEEPMSGCNLSDPDCATCKTRFEILPGFWGCDGACTNCPIR